METNQDPTAPLVPDSDTKKKKRKRAPCFKRLTRKQANTLVIDSDLAIQETLAQLQEVRDLVAKAGLSIECTTLPKTTVTASLGDPPPNNHTGGATNMDSHDINPMVVMTTGGHSNTDHTIVRTGDERIDRIADLRRTMWRRHRLMQPEVRQEGRWDRPRLPGERRRRVVRERDLPEAPPEPPITGFMVFLFQMTVKIRHDRPDMPHEQTKVVQEVSKLWRQGLSEEERNYYNLFANESQETYNRQMIEYRATGTYTPNEVFIKVPGANVWVRQPEHQNALEKEICSYETMVFPKRPPSMEEAFAERQRQSIFRRKLRMKGLMNQDGTLKDGLDFDELYQEHLAKEQAKKSKQQTSNKEEGTTSGSDEEVPEVKEESELTK